MMKRYPLGLLLSGLLLCVGLFSFPALAQERPLNDTGQTTCFDMDGQETPCSAPGFPGFDARFGRDAAALDGVLPRHGDGTGGFDFTKISNDGGELEPEATLGSEPENWACTQDNHTGLLWEIKIDDADSPRHYGWGYLWFDPDSEFNGGDPGFESPASPLCGFTLECNTRAYIEYINGIGLCGRGDWRLPTLDELGGIVNYGSYGGTGGTGGALDGVYFADGGEAHNGWRGGWTSDSGHEPEEGHAAWHISFFDGALHQAPKGNDIGVRLVSGEPPEHRGEMAVCGERHNEQIQPSTAGFFHHSEPGLAWDERTGLTWARCAIGQEFEGDGEELHCEGEPMRLPWQEAMQMVQERNDEEYGGYNDWRLPNLKELQSIAERQCFGPVVDLRMFPEEGLPYWSSTSSAGHPDHAWAIEFFGGNYHPTPKGEAWPVVRLVRGGAEFDDYQGGLSYSVGGSVNEMVGAGLGLRLETSTGESESITINADGPFVFSHGFSEGDGYDISVEQAPVPYQSCTVENGSGEVNGNVNNVAVVCEAPDPAQIEVNPSSFALTVYEEGSSSDELTITNAGGGFLDWSIATAFPGASGLRGGVIDCEGEPGIIIHDDGTAENTISGNRFWAEGFMMVDRFTPESYPASIGSVCLALVRHGNDTTVNFDIVVLDDNGPGNSPGTVLGAQAVTITDIQPESPHGINWYSYDLSSLYTTIESGSVYIGVRFNGGSFAEPDTIASLLLDMTEDERPAGYAGGYFWNWGQSGEWVPLQEMATTMVEYRALFVRAVEAGPQDPPVGCDAPNAIPWLDLGLTAGSTPAGESDAVSLTVNGLGMEGGTYEALLCVNSNDPDNPRVEVPVSLTVNVGAAELAVSPDSLDFGGVVLGSSATLTATITNVGTFAATITGIGAAPGVYGVEPIGELELEPGASTTTEVTFTPVAGGEITGTLSVFGHDSGGEELPTATATLSGIGLVPPEAAVDPESLTLEVEYGMTGTSSLMLSNEAEAGALDLNFVTSVAVARARTTRLVELSGVTRTVQEVGETGLMRANGSAAIFPYTVIEGAPFAYQAFNQLMITHSASQAILGEHGISCGATSGSHTEDNSYWRVFDLSQFPEVEGGFTVTSVGVGVESVIGPSLPSTVILYTLSGDFTMANLTQVGEADFTLVSGTSLEIVNVPIEAEFEDTDQLVVEWRTGSGEESGTHYYPGANSAGETSPTYFSTVGCGLLEPVTMASIDFPDVHWVLNVHGEKDLSLLSVSPESGMVAPGESQEITLMLDASEDLPGEYALEVLFATNDPERPSMTVPVNITVTGGAPELVLNPNSLDFGEVIVGLSATREITVTNIGTLEATITAIETSDDVFSLTFDGPVTLAAGESTTTEVAFTPIQAGSHEGTLTITTDGADLTASLTGEALDQPTPEISVTEFEIEVVVGETTSDILTLSNIGGEAAANLEYEISVVSARSENGGTSARDLTTGNVHGEVTFSDIGSGTPDVAGRFGEAFSLADGSTAGAPYMPYDGFQAGVWRGNEVLITHSASQDIVPFSGVSCPTAPNHHFRVFDLSEFIDGDLEVTSVDIGIEEIVAQTTTVNLYRLDGAFVMANLELVSTASLPVSPSDGLSLVNVPISGSFSNDDVLVLEWVVPQSTVYFGGNELGQTDPTYLLALGCGATEPMNLAELGDFPLNAWVANVHGTSGPGLLAVTPESGTISPGDSEDLTFFVDGTEAEPGDYSFDVIITTNDPVTPTVTVPVLVTVKPFVNTEDGGVPTVFSLAQNFPNPFSGQTTITFEIPQAEHVLIEVIDLTGRRIAVLVDEQLEAASHDVTWNANGLASGVYLYRMQAGSFTKTLRTTIVR